MTKLTIITINYNNREGLARTLKSALRQTHQDFEYIAIDGGSNDGSKELLEKHSTRFAFWVSEKDAGIYNAINKGLTRASGEYILILNSGDELHSETTLATVMGQLASGEDVIYGDSEDFYPDSKKKSFIRRYPSKLTFDFLFRSALRHQAMLIRRDAYKKVGPYSEEYKIVSDWLWVLRALVHFQCSHKHLDLIVCRYERGGISSANMDLNLSEREQVMQKEFPLLVDDYKKMQRMKRQFINWDFILRR